MKETAVDLLVIGGGPAGMAAALGAAAAGVGDILLVDRLSELGGILPQCIHNGFGLRYFREELTGPEYAARFTAMLHDYPQIRLKLDTMVIELTAQSAPLYRVVTVNPAEGMVHYHPKAIVLAMGCRERSRGAINLPGTRPAGIYTAGTVQRLMNLEGFRPGNQAVILGSGDIGLIMARRLTLEGIRVAAVVELMPYSAGLTRNLVQCLDDFQIPLYLSHTISAVSGDQRLQAVSVAPVDQNRQPLTAQSFTIPCDTLVLSVGLIPENELSRLAGVALDPATAGPVVGPDYQTTVPGIFACGNTAHVHDLVDDVSLEGALAGKAAAAYIRGRTPDSASRRLEPGRNIRSVVPQFVAANEPTTIYIRVRFPEKNVRLRVGSSSVPERIVTPGETIRYTVKPEDIKDCREIIPLGIEKAS